jgi:predicted ATPase
MTTPITKQATIQRLHIQNYRVLRDVQFRDLTPLTVLLGPNGSGKSTVFDVFAFLHDAFTTNLRAAWDRRNRIHELRSRGENGPITIEIAYRQAVGERLVTYRLRLDEENSSPVVVEEVLRWSTAPGSGAPRDILSFRRGEGRLYDEARGVSTDEKLDSSDLLAVSTLGGLARYPQVSHLRRFISGWYLSYLGGGTKRTVPEAGPQARLSETGDNLPNVVQYLTEQHPGRLAEILRVLAERVPQLERVDTELLADGRLLLRFKDAPFDEPVLAKYASDGTLKLLAYLTVLYDPAPPPIVGIEEPENFLHPQIAPRPGRGGAGSSGSQSASRHHALAVLRRRVASQGVVGALPRRRWFRPHGQGIRHEAGGRADLRGGLAREPVDGRLLRGWRSAGPRRSTENAGQRVNLEILVEERSAESTLEVLLPRAAAAGLSTATAAPASRRVHMLNRIAVEELEAWFFGDVPVICAAYPRVPVSIGQQAKHRDSHAIAGGTWEALERVLQKGGYHLGGLAKVAAATEIAQHMNVDANRSRSFQVFRDGVRRLVAGGSGAAED